MIYNKIDMCNLVTKNLQGGAKSAFFCPYLGKNLVEKIFFTRKKRFYGATYPKKRLQSYSPDYQQVTILKILG